MTRRIDSHHHFWRYSAEEYDWIDARMQRIRRNFLPADLQPELNKAKVDAVISVQARQTTEETEWLLSMAEQRDWIAGVVGWAPLVSPDLEGWLDRWSERPKLRGLRHVLQGEPDPGFMLRPAFQDGISLLRRHGFVYDILIYENQLEAAIKLVSAHPDQQFVLDHIAKPQIKANRLEPWRTLIRDISRRENVACKLSGMVTEGDWENWTASQLRPYFEIVLEAFGPNRLMAGSDWPVCLVATEYDRWWETIQEWIAPLTPTERQEIESGAAIRAYGLRSQ